MSGKKRKKAKKQKKQKKQKQRDKNKAKKGKVAPKARPKAKLKANSKTAAPAAKAPTAKPAPATPASAGPATRAQPGKAAAAPPRRSSRRSALSQRRGPHGELLAPGDLLLLGGPKTVEEVQYLFRGAVAAERPASDEGVAEVIAKKGTPEAEGERPDLNRQVRAMLERFEKGSIEPMLPGRSVVRRNFQGVVERAKQRRREIGAFLRGLDLGRTETSHMDSHGEASLQGLMEWAARLENLAEADEPDQADYAQFHRGLDQLENTTEALIIDVEQTLRRLRDRIRSS